MNFFTRPENAERLANLITLRDGLQALYGEEQYSPYFDMDVYCKRLLAMDARGCGLRPNKTIPESVRDPIGHGPQFGIGPDYAGTWDAYNEAYFCDPDMLEWSFLFDSEWPSNIQQFIKRADIVISGKRIHYWWGYYDFTVTY